MWETMLQIPHIETIAAAYAVTAVAIAAMVLRISLDYRALSAKAARLARDEESREGRRR